MLFKSKRKTQQFEQLIQAVTTYINEHYEEPLIEDVFEEKHWCSTLMSTSCPEPQKEEIHYSKTLSIPPASFTKPNDLETFLKQKDDTFAVTLVDLIERSGKKNSVIYKKANVDKKLFSKIINNVKYHPSKQTAIAFAIALELDLEATQDLIGRAGYTLTHSSRFDLIIECFIRKKNYNIFEINEVLFEFDEVLLGY